MLYQRPGQDSGPLCKLEDHEIAGRDHREDLSGLEVAAWVKTLEKPLRLAVVANVGVERSAAGSLLLYRLLGGHAARLPAGRRCRSRSPMGE